MIHLCVEDYCQDCSEFDPVTENKNTKYVGYNFDGVMHETYTLTEVHCSKEKRCRAIFNYLKNQVEKKE